MRHVHPFSQRNKASKIAGSEGWKQRKDGLDKFKNGGVGNIGGLHNIGGPRSPPLTMIHKELFWKKDALVV